MNPDLVAYIRSQMSAGADAGALRKTLLENGWSDGDITTAFASRSSGSLGQSSVSSTQVSGSQKRRIGKAIGIFVCGAALGAGACYLAVQKFSIVTTTEAPLPVQEAVVPLQASTTPSVTTRAEEPATSTPVVAPKTAEKAPVVSAPKSSSSEYYTLKNNVLTVDKEKFPKTIGEYQFIDVDTSYGTETQRAFMVIYAKTSSPAGRIGVNMGQGPSSALAKATEKMEKYTYKNSTVSYYEGGDAAYIWETDRPLNGVVLLYTNARGEDKVIHNGGSEAEFLVLDWFLKEFPVK